MQTKESVGQHSTLDQREKWQSEAKMIQEFGEEELYHHVDSGRIIWRADPWTSGVYNYRGLGDIVKHTKVRKTKNGPKPRNMKQMKKLTKCGQICGAWMPQATFLRWTGGTKETRKVCP